MAACGRLLECLKQGLLMVTEQPRGSFLANQIPGQVHAVSDGWPSIDDITAEDQMVPERENRQQIDQGSVAAMNITNDPVVSPHGCQQHEQTLMILHERLILSAIAITLLSVAVSYGSSFPPSGPSGCPLGSGS